MQWVMAQAGLEVFDVELNDVYGGSFRVFVKRAGQRACAPTARYRRLLEQERADGLFGLDGYRAFDDRIARTRADLRAVCARILGEGKTLWAYGASTKGNTILQYCGLTGRDVAAAADANPFKFGRWMIGSDIPIADESAMRAARPDYLLALPYSFVDAFVRREAELVARGTRFIAPLPDVRIVPA
jgi:hypothetical protein